MDNKILIAELIKQNLLSDELGKKLLNESSLSKKNVEELIHDRRIIDEEQIANIKGKILNIPHKAIKVEEIDAEILKLVPAETVRNYKIIPISRSGDMLVVGMVNPEDSKAQEAIKFVAKQLRINLGIYLVGQSVWEAILRRYSPYSGEVEIAIRSLNIDSKDASNQRIIQLESASTGSASEEAPIIRIVATTLKEAVWQKSSDIHIEPQRNRLRVRFR